MEALKYLDQIVDVKIDRPLGSKHPKWNFTYDVNYGYIPGTLSGDGEELDVYILGVEEPLKEFSGRCVAILHRTNDDDDKLIVVPDGFNVSDEIIREKTYFQERYFESEIYRK
ncbi:inorganic diphosphatase [Candidatus Woesearchaeota archaeon]|nr:inorganic diphosphatase [Candidatus Woesearchaeota archaeon]